MIYCTLTSEVSNYSSGVAGWEPFACGGGGPGPTPESDRRRRCRRQDELCKKDPKKYECCTKPKKRCP